MNIMKMNKFLLNKENPEIEFNLNSEESYLLIQSVYVTAKNNSASQWSKFISNVQIIAELKYVVFDDAQERFIDERRKQFPIHLLTNPYQIQPVFQLNKLIKNETFTLGINPDLKFYQTLKLELEDYKNLDSNHTLELNIEKFKIDE